MEKKILLSHERDVNGLAVELGGHLGGLADVPAVHQPEPGRHGRREVDALVDERQGRRTGDVLPLGPGCATWSSRNTWSGRLLKFPPPRKRKKRRPGNNFSSPIKSVFSYSQIVARGRYHKTLRICRFRL